ncbi:hypothetical protein FRB98_004034, partial [Tulasnella sp. 332]
MLATWWECLINTYTTRPNVVIARRDATAEISRDVYTFFKDSTFLLSFLNVPIFFDTFYHPERRAAVQPALVLSVLAWAKLAQSNLDTSRKQSLEEREQAWKQSAQLRDLAQASFEASYNAGWINLPLAQAAWILVLYEMSPHRGYAPHRLQSSITLLDNTIRYLGLTTIDANDPRASTFIADAVPAIGRPTQNGVAGRVSPTEYNDTTFDLQATFRTSPPVGYPSTPGPIRFPAIANNTSDDIWHYPIDRLPLHLNSAPDSGPSSGCPCQALSLCNTPELLRSTPSWMFMPKWADNTSLGEIMKEQARRLVCNSVIILGSDMIPTWIDGVPRLDLHISRPEN